MLAAGDLALFQRGNQPRGTSEDLPLPDGPATKTARVPTLGRGRDAGDEFGGQRFAPKKAVCIALLKSGQTDIGGVGRSNALT